MLQSLLTGRGRFVLLLLGLLVTPSSRAGVFSINAWTNDASSGIVPGQTVWAYHFGVTNVATVNGVTVPGVGTNGNPAVAGQFSVTGIPFVFLNDNNLLTALGGSGSAVMARNFLYGGAPGRITVEGLTTGQVYTVSIYGVSFDPPTTRASNFTNGTDTIYVNENASPTRIGVRVDYTFTATATTNLTLVMPTNANTFHTYGLALRQPLLVTTTSDGGPGSLRQAVLDAAALPGAETITFAPALSGATITLSNEIILPGNMTIDASSLPGGMRLSGGNVARIFTVTTGQPVSLLGLTLTDGNGVGADITGTGGAVVVGFGSTLSMSRCTLSDNAAAGSGGAIENFQGTLTLLECTLVNNRANQFGGGIDNFGGPLALTHCTLVGNQANSGGGVFDGGGQLNLTNCIVAGNTAAVSPDLRVLNGSFNRGGANIVQATTIFAGVTESGPALLNVAPLLAPFGNYGGPTQTMPPLPGSPAMDAASVVAGLTTDQRGSARVSGAAPDIGAVESSGLWVQNTNDAGVDSLRGVIFNLGVGGLTNVIVNFVPSLSGATITLSSEIVLTNTTAIVAGSLPAGITVNGGNATRLFRVSSGSTASLSGLNLTGGNAAGSSGGAILNQPGATLSLTRCTLSGNTAPQAGAIASYGQAALLSHCTLAGNSGNFGGAIENSGGPLTLTHCTLASNQSTGPTAGFDGGGAIDSYNGATVTLTACVFTGNTATSGTGPEMWMESGVLNATNCLIGDGKDSTMTNGVNSNLVGTTASPINALLAPLGNYGGPTRTMPPLPGSPAINAAGTSSFTTEQRGYPRSVGLAADIGAVEGIYNAAGPGSITNLTRLANGTMRLSFTNLTDASFPVLASTNVSQPLSNWTVIGYAAESAAGNRVFQFTDADAAKYPQRYYRVKSP